MATPLRVLLVEDEPLIAMMAEDMIDAVGGAVAASVSTVADARDAIARGGFDLALVDVNLGGESGIEVADLLRDGGHRYVFTTGYDLSARVDGHADAPVLSKPYSMQQLQAALTP